MRHLSLPGVLLCLLTAVSAITEAADADLPPSSSTEAGDLCTHKSMALEDTEAKTTPLFPEMRELALEVRRTLCIREGKREQVLAAFSVFVAKAIETQWFNRFGGFRDGQEPMFQVRNALQASDPIPTMAKTLVRNEVSIKDKAQATVYTAANPELCERQAGGGRRCDDVLAEFMHYYNYAHTSFASEGAMAFARTVSGLSKEWDAYLESTRSLTPLELLINSYLFKRSETAQFSSPPTIQWIALHPSLVVENVSDAIGGEKLKEALMIEIAGANWWKQDKWYLPTGGSVITAYADRPDVKEWGYGVALHFGSLFSVGYTRRDDDNGVLISVDLLKFIQDNKKIIDEYKP